MFGQLDRRHLPRLFDSLHRALLETQTTAMLFNKELHCIHISWQALASVDNALEIGGLALAVTLVEIGSRKANFKARFDAFAVFLFNYEFLCAKPVIRIIQSLLTLDWQGEYVVEGFREKCLFLLDALYNKYSAHEYLGPLFHNETIAKSALSDRFQRNFATAFASQERTLLDYPFLFSHSDKIALFEFWVISEMERQHRQGWSLRRMARYFYNLGFHVEHPQSAYFGITAERQDILHDVTKAITGQSISVLRRPIKVKYAGEQGIDLAGLTSDLLAKVIKSSILRCLDLGLLREAKAIWFQEGADGEGEFKRLGVLIGLAMYNGVKSLPLDFPSMFYKKLVGEPLELDDMNEFDPDLLRGWKMLMECHVDDLTFEYNYQIGGEIHTHVLEYSDDQPTAVTKDNRHQYVQMLFDAVSDKLIAQSFNALQTGLESIIPRRVLHFFTPSQLRSLMAGQRVMDVTQAVTLLKQVTVYDGYHPAHPLIIALWNLLSNGTPDQFSKFLDLTTATDRLPASFPANFKLTIFKSGTDQEMYPPNRARLIVGFPEDRRVCMDWDYQNIVPLKSYVRNYS
jgi:ubiquitin-protein ligase E3 A